ncbi:PhoPQ-regulated protein, partial [Solirubrobacter sp. CPCC 204708]|nr:PhoPQ-regulated protein [Solirubrobacter deserti]
DSLACYHDAIERQPLIYSRDSIESVDGVEKRNYLLTSQEWSPEGIAQPALWKHDVAIYVPKDALPKRALLISTNGTRNPEPGKAPEAASELTSQDLAMIATRSRTVVVALSDIPNQYLTFGDDGRSRREDDSVAHTWARFLEAPEQRKTMPFHVPMSAAIARAMTLAELELRDLHIHRFVLAGASKRGWASWHALIADRRVEAVVPIVIDILNMKVLLEHMNRAYGGHWPVAFDSYVEEGITQRLDSPEFANLLKIQDSFEYLNSPYRDRL